MTRAWTFYYTLLTVLSLTETAKRTYYIGIREEYWNYAPSQRNLINGADIRHDVHASQDLVNASNQIGNVYKKAVYIQYTDGTFTNDEPKPNWLGFLGPVIRAEVGDEIVVHLKNFATRLYSIHPHGVLYKKDSEGAWYPDGTSGRNKSDDAVYPGQAYTYTWKVTEEFAPTETDSDCLTSMYHSHVNAPKDIASGLIGGLLICKKGASNPSGLLQSHEFFLMFSAVDENLSWYLDENIIEFCRQASCQKEDAGFHNSNQLHTINGFIYGNLPTLEVCLRKPVSWHLFGIGNEIDLHSIHFYGHTLLNQGHRTDVLSVFPATSVTAQMIPMTTGKWLFGCQVEDHMHAGMQGFFEVVSCGNDPPPPVLSGRIRRYYIAAEETLWDYAPSGKNLLSDQPLTTNKTNSDSEEFFSTTERRLGGKYWKVRYTGYHDDTFTSKIEQSGSEHHLGILGPVIRGEPGDVIEVTFRNKAQRNFSMQPHGVSYEKGYEGILYQDGFQQKQGASVAPGQTFTYRWHVTEGPSPSDPPCLSYLYYSATYPINDTNSGLVGPLQVCRKGVLDESGRQHIGSEVQKEFFLLFTVMDENKSWYLQKNIKEFGNASDPDDQQFQESNKMRSVNGFMYGNIPNLEMCDGDHVVWHLMGLGSVDLYGIYFQGNTFQLDNTTRDTLTLFPHSSVTVSMKPDNDGLFELSCLTTPHYRGGMRQLYFVKRCTADQYPESTTFRPDVYFYLAAEEVEWDYAPNRTWELEKHNTTLGKSPGRVYLEKSENQIGSVYKKVVYRKYKDGSFTKQETPEDHLGILGPILRVQVGEKVQVVFKNKATRPYSVHAHGVKTSKAEPVYPGNTSRYNWTISSGPGATEPNCTAYAYYSSVNFVQDLASGLVGPLVVCRKGTLYENRTRNDVDKDFALLFMVFDENDSWYLEENVQTYLKKNLSTIEEEDDDGFLESNLMHGINGKMYANLHGLKMQQGQRTEWYLMALGSDQDMHTVHFHDQSFIYKTDHPHRADVYALFPGTFKTVELQAGAPGTWLLHCHVADHVDAGMETTYTIEAAKSKAWTNGIVFLQLFCRMLPAITLAFWLQ